MGLRGFTTFENRESLKTLCYNQVLVDSLAITNNWPAIRVCVCVCDQGKRGWGLREVDGRREGE